MTCGPPPRLFCCCCSSEGGGFRSMKAEMCSKLPGFPEGTYLAVHPLPGGGTSASERCLLVEGVGWEGSAQPARECEGTHVSRSAARPGQPSRSRLCSWLGPAHCYTISFTDFSTLALPAAPQSQGGGGISQGRKNKWLSRGLAVGGGREGAHTGNPSQDSCHLVSGTTCGEVRTRGRGFCKSVGVLLLPPSGSAGPKQGVISMKEQDISRMQSMALGK